MSKGAIERAFNLAAKNLEHIGGKRAMLFKLNISESYMYAAIKKNKVSVTLAMKLQVLTKNEVKWGEMCPEEQNELNNIAKLVA